MSSINRWTMASAREAVALAPVRLCTQSPVRKLITNNAVLAGPISGDYTATCVPSGGARGAAGARGLRADLSAVAPRGAKAEAPRAKAGARGEGLPAVGA